MLPICLPLATLETAAVPFEEDAYTYVIGFAYEGHTYQIQGENTCERGFPHLMNDDKVQCGSNEFSHATGNTGKLVDGRPFRMDLPSACGSVGKEYPAARKGTKQDDPSIAQDPSLWVDGKIMRYVNYDILSQHYTEK